jgi:hypothetical protein
MLASPRIKTIEHYHCMVVKEKREFLYSLISLLLGAIPINNFFLFLDWRRSGGAA